MTAKPCDTHPDLRCATGGSCWGALYFGKPGEKAVPLAQVLECKWRETVLERMRREGEE
ncbi:hypothetical protein [Solidesulfovibrio sp.]